MARGSEYRCFVTAEESIAILERIAAETPLFGRISTFGPFPRIRLEFSFENMLKLKNDGVQQMLELRTSPAAYEPDDPYYDAQIAHGFICMDIPNFARNECWHTSLTVGYDDPVDGIPSPKPLFRRLKRELSKICTIPVPEWARGYMKGLKASPNGATKFVEPSVAPGGVSQVKTIILTKWPPEPELWEKLRQE